MSVCKLSGVRFTRYLEYRVSDREFKKSCREMKISEDKYRVMVDTVNAG